ncbi:MAG TPA: penicillin-binding protein [Terriglobales bacterium]|jgi:cell division protein FtsI (penicillin-binding protein 3)|nr:penicillin-binding protein [Terriglobales bacterium]
MAVKGNALNPRQRLLIFAGILVLWLLIICGRLVYLQIFSYGDFVQRAARQQQRTIDVAPSRGIIYDRSGHELAMSVAVDSIYAVPSDIPDQATAASLLGRILQEDPHELLARMKSSRSFAWIARKVDPATSDRIRALNLKGINFQKESKRYYPKRELAAQTLGYVGLDDEGLGGLERSFDARLRGKPGKMLISMDARRKWFGRVERQPEPGENLVLTIDEKIQYLAERQLEAAMKQTHAVAGTVIVQNPHTGEILALANYPTFNANTFNKSDVQALKNRAVSDVYEPGSTFKVVTLAAALEEKLTRPEEVFDCENGSIVINNLRIHDHKPYGLLTVSQILANSSDVGAIKVALRLGDERFDHYIRAFGFGRQTGIELPGETRGLAKPVSRWSKVSIGAISMGQEIGVSALQLISMISTIANDGVYTPPRLVAGSVDSGKNSDGRLQQVVFHPGEQHRVISTLTAAEMKKMLEGVVLYGTGTRALLDGYTVAGKTGTAQKIDPRSGTYSRTNYIASFAGFAPVNNPAISVEVILDSPLGDHEGGGASAPVFARVAQGTLEYLNVPHDAEINDRRRQTLHASVKPEDTNDSSPDRLGDTTAIADNAPTDNEAETSAQSSASAANTAKPAAAHVMTASLKVKNKNSDQAAQTMAQQLTPVTPAANSSPPPRGTVIVDIGGGAVAPSLLGLPVRTALETAQQAGIEIDIVGSGVAREQFPPPGARLAPGAHVSVRFAR